MPPACNGVYNHHMTHLFLQFKQTWTCENICKSYRRIPSVCEWVQGYRPWSIILLPSSAKIIQCESVWKAVKVSRLLLTVCAPLTVEDPNLSGPSTSQAGLYATLLQTHPHTILTTASNCTSNIRGIRWCTVFFQKNPTITEVPLVCECSNCRYPSREVDRKSTLWPAEVTFSIK